MKTILVTGANGQLGNEIKKLSHQYSDFSFYFTDIDTLDITNLKELQLFFNNNKVKYIINAAAYTKVDQAEEESKLAQKINVEGTANLARLATNFKCYLFHISTDYVFDGTKNTPYNEDDTPNPQCIYGKTKLLSENEALRHNETMIIRTSWLYSTFGHNFVKTIIKLAREKEKINVVYDQIGSPTYAEDLASAILEIISNQIFKRGIYHFANKGVCSWFDFAYKIVSFYNFPCAIEPILTHQYPTPAKRPHYSVLHTEKFRQTFNIDIPYWQDSLIKCLTEIKL